MVETPQGRAIGTDGNPDDDTSGIDRNGHVGGLFDEVFDVLGLWKDTSKETL
jgi:hypothetical protein